MSKTGSLERVKKRALPFFECGECKRLIEEGEFIAVIGMTPSTVLSMPLGRADAILKKTGNIYCEHSYKKRS